MAATIISIALRRQIAAAIATTLGIGLVPQIGYAEPAHGIAMIGEPALAAGFDHLPYVNPEAPKGGKITYGAETPNAKTGSLAPGAPDALCMTPGPNPVLFVGDLYPSRIYKVSLDGTLLGVYGQPGRNLGEFGWIHAIACPSENEIWVGELINWRVQKLVTKKGGSR